VEFCKEVYEYVVYSITEILSLHRLKCLQNHSVYSEVKVLTDVGVEHIK
jgi:hypothetical protein